MEHGACNVVYTNRRAYDEHVRKETLSRSLIAQSATGTAPQGYFPNGKSPPADMNSNVELILSIFNQGKLHLLPPFAI
jgi:3',5'-cyclic-nucleotide phosphodiesterase